jgi:GNAT superfamily N-acetyltransferase
MWLLAEFDDGRHPDLHMQERTCGVCHSAGGRYLPRFVTAAAPGFDDPAGWSLHKSFQPSQIAQQGASAYSSLQGLPDPHSGSTDYLNAKRTPESVKAVSQNYDSLPEYDPDAVKHFDAMQRDVKNQHDFMTKHLGIQTQTVDQDPYKDVHEMMHDINNNKRLQVLGTHATGGHPYFDDDTNDKFRAVHDFFGHAATGRSFDRHGEQAAYLAHAKMFSPEAQPALATETRGQNSSLIYNGGFQPQKTALLHPQFWSGGGALHVAMGARGDLPDGLQISHDPELDLHGRHVVKAHHNGEMVGSMKFLPSDRGSKIDYISTHPDYRRTGVGTAMLNYARENIDPNVTHSADVTPSGKGFAKSDGFKPTSYSGEPDKWRNSPVRDDSWEWPNATQGNGHNWNPRFSPKSKDKFSAAPPGHFDDKWKSDTMDTINHPQTGGGFTMRDRPGDGPTSGTMVSLPRSEGHEESGLTRDQVNGDNQADYMDRKWDKIHEPNNYGGGWDEKGKWYNDVSKNFKDPWEAAGYAMKGQQNGVYDLDGYYDKDGKPTDVETPQFFHDQIAKGGSKWLT